MSVEAKEGLTLGGGGGVFCKGIGGYTELYMQDFRSGELALMLVSWTGN